MVTRGFEGELPSEMPIEIRVIANDFAELESLNATQWLRLCSGLKSHGILGVFSKKLDACAPAAIRALLERERDARLRKANERLKILLAFDERAKREHLRYLVIKGMAASVLLFEDYAARESGDIDLIVHPDDIPKADYVARRAGLIQPAEVYRVRRACNERGRMESSLLKDLESPYVLRSNDFLPHVTNYYAIADSGAVESLEIHDKLHLFGGVAIGDILWMSQSIDINGLMCQTISNPFGAFMAAASLHEDAEGVRANTVPYGNAGLKSCVDLHYWLRKLSSHGALDGFFNLVRAVGADIGFSALWGDLLELFPADAELLEGAIKVAVSSWPLSYLERVVLSEKKAEACTAFVLRTAYIKWKALEKFVVDDARRSLPTANGLGESPFAVSAKVVDGALIAEWTMPSSFVETAKSMVFQCVAVGILKEEIVAKRVNVFFENGKGWMSDVTDVGSGTVITNANRLVHGWAAIVNSAFENDGSAALSCRIPFDCRAEDARVVFSVHDLIVGQLYRRCAGFDLIEQLEHAKVDLGDIDAGYHL